MLSGDMPKQLAVFDRQMFNPTRFACARKRTGLTKSQLARQIGVNLRSVVAYESGHTVPSADTLEKILEATGFPADFFSGDDLEEPKADATSFRALTKMTARQRDLALSQGVIAIHLSKYIEELFELPTVDLPDLRHESSPESASETLRQHWGIGVLPIRNMVHLMEAKGVRIFSLAIEAREVDAFSMWKNETPFVFLNTYKSSERSRFDAAHELGHLVLHRHATPHGREAEREADNFASAFLMPRAGIIAHAVRFPTFSDLVNLKKIWNISVAALNYRLHEVGMISDWQYRMLCIEIAKYGRTKEPSEAPRETSQILPKVFAALYNENVSRADVAKDLSIPRSELEELMFGLTLTTLDGGRKGRAPLRVRLPPLT
jgi:Zn-dependent peptidase ImmA (M78 family)/DNA-binding XRE family transcriptional regulator